ncbi:MAG: TonB-dependent receptor [Gammaproteobacteria bacterium]|nr:TonB-dependent receptor [Gammaproteobacteria bacterium]
MSRSATLWMTGTLLAGLWSTSADAKETLKEVVVTATRIQQRLSDVPGGVTIIEQRDLQLGRQQLGLDEALARVPGVFFQDRYNFAQDLRIAVRGFGARSNFGIRGVKVFVDDIPSTLPDGQSGVDDIDLGSLSRAEVIRGPSSSIYGSSSGGVLNLYTEDGPDTPFAEAGITIGAFDQQKYQLKAGGQHGDLNYLLNGSYLNYDGYRDHSEVNHALFNSKFRYDVDAASDLTLVFNLVDSPVADDPGALTAADVEADPRQAQPRNLSSDAGESLQQQKFGWLYRREFGSVHELRLRNYYTWRDFRNLLPLGTHIPFSAIDGVVEFDRFFYGGGVQYTYSGNFFGRGNRVTAGFDVDVQEDDRQRYVNSSGAQGPLTFDQLEEANAWGFYVRDALALSDSLELTVGGRFDVIDLSVDDRFPANGDQSSSLDFDEFSPSVGLTWNAWKEIYLFAGYATAFETPTFTELGTPAQELNANLGGFANVQAQTATGFESGARGMLWDGANFEIAAFHMDVEDEITNVVSVANRAFFENADTDRTGVEASFVAEWYDGLRLTAAYTYSDFTFESFPSNPAAVGSHLPGIPEQQFYAELAYFHESGFYVVWDVLVVDELFTNNLNTEVSPGYTVSNLRLGGEFNFGSWRLSPYVGLNNLFDESYSGNVRLNAFGGRTFEPAPGFNPYGGVKVGFDF